MVKGCKKTLKGCRKRWWREEEKMVKGSKKKKMKGSKKMLNGKWHLRVIVNKGIENVSDVFNFSFPDDFRNCIKNIRNYNMNKLIFAHLNVNWLISKFDLLSKQIKSPIKILMISETKLDNSFPDGKFFYWRLPCTF